MNSKSNNTHVNAAAGIPAPTNSEPCAVVTTFVGMSHTHVDLGLHEQYSLGVLSNISLDDIVVVPGFNPRAHLGDITDLTESIGTNGLMNPLVVRPGPRGYSLVCGERRYRALRSFECSGPVPCIVRNDLMGEDARSLAVALADNVDRRHGGSTLNAIEIGRGLLKLFDAGWHPLRIREQTGITPSAAHKAIELVHAPADVRKKVVAGLNPSAALEYAKLNKEIRAAVGKEITRHTTVLDIRRIRVAYQGHATLAVHADLAGVPKVYATAWRRTWEKRHTLQYLCANLVNASPEQVGTIDHVQVEGTVATLLWDRGDLVEPFAPEASPDKHAKDFHARMKARAVFDALVKSEAAKAANT